MTETYLAALVLTVASLAIGQGALALCGARRWTWLSPAVGLALVCAICWATVRLPGDALFAALALLLATIAALLGLRGRVEAAGQALRVGGPVALLALAAASLPFAVEGAFGILGTSFNPDMSQHLLAAERLAQGEPSELLRQGYPLGPHAVAAALERGLGIGLVQGFDGLTIAVAVLASLTALAALAEIAAPKRTAAALVVGIPYVVASYFAQGAFKETMQALFVLAFVLALREVARSQAWRALPLRFLPAALVAVGSVYAYSFPGLIWLFAAFVLWLAVERRLPIRPLLLALAAFAVLVAPEVGRMLDFQRFETFDPDGPGLGNLFGQISPLEALGIWPSGDFRVAPGDGVVPAAGYYLGAAFALACLGFGLLRCWQRREGAILAGFGAVLAAYAAARLGGTPYTAAKAIEVASPVVALAIVLPLARAGCRWGRSAAFLYLAAAGACSVLALANAPVGPTSYSPALAELRPISNTAPTLVLASEELLSERHGTQFLAWELRGGRVCIQAEEEAGAAPPAGVRFVISEGPAGSPPFERLRPRRVAAPYVLWERSGPIRRRSPCPLVEVRQARQAPPR